jgi:hypothetical protein
VAVSQSDKDNLRRQAHVPALDVGEGVTKGGHAHASPSAKALDDRAEYGINLGLLDIPLFSLLGLLLGQSGVAASD